MKRNERGEKHAICIQCHEKAEMINFLIKSMPEDIFDFYIHVDLKSDMINQIERKSNIFFAERVNVQWGQFSQVEATLSMFRMIKTEKYNYIHLISGNDFFMLNPDEMINFFEGTDLEYIQSNPLDEKCTWTWHGQDRYSVWYPQWMIHRPADTKYRVMRIAYREFIMRTKIFKRRNLPVSDFYGGSSWFSITGGALKWMMQYISEHPEYVEFYKHGVCVDEIFFATLIRYSPYIDRIANDPLRFMRWRGSTSGGPKLISEDDFNDMLQSECVWARKFDDLETISKWYNVILKKDRDING